MMTNKAYLAIVFPFILTSLTIPLLGMVDTAIMGHLPDAAYIGGVAIGTVIFNSIYWLFGFLRVSTTGFTAQAKFQDNNEEAKIYALARPLFIATVLGIIFIIFQNYILYAFMYFLGPDKKVALHASQYFYVLIWGAPFVLINYVLTGWLMGMTKLKVTVMLQIGINVLNIILAFLLVMVWDYKVYGLASATLISQIVFTFFSYLIVQNYSHIKLTQLNKSILFQYSELKKMMNVNRDLMLRTVFFLIVTNIFMGVSASFGKDTLAANAILFQIQYLIAYLYDGFGNASSIISGEAVGQKNYMKLKQGINLSFRWGVITTIVITLGYWLLAQPLISMFTLLPQVRAIAFHYSIWLIIFPATACFGLIFYGVFSGATFSAPIRDSAFWALVVFIISLWFCKPYGNDGLWVAFLLFSATRSLCLVLSVFKLKRRFQSI